MGDKWTLAVLGDFHGLQAPPRTVARNSNAFLINPALRGDLERLVTSAIWRAIGSLTVADWKRPEKQRANGLPNIWAVMVRNIAFHQIKGCGCFESHL